jgi:hypothetical protein
MTKLKPTEKPDAKHKFKAKSDGVITVSAPCAELKHDPKLARAKLRAAVKDPKQYPELAKSHTARKAWEWPKGSSAIAEARKARSLADLNTLSELSGSLSLWQLWTRVAPVRGPSITNARKSS